MAGLRKYIEDELKGKVDTSVVEFVLSLAEFIEEGVGTMLFCPKTGKRISEHTWTDIINSNELFLHNQDMFPNVGSIPFDMVRDIASKALISAEIWSRETVVSKRHNDWRTSEFIKDIADIIHKTGPTEVEEDRPK